MSVGSRIKELRNSLDLTQQKFADRLGIQRGGCSAGLLGVQSMRGKTLAELWQTPVELSSGPAPPPLHISPSEGGTSLPYRTSKPSVSGRLVLRNRS